MQKNYNSLNQEDKIRYKELKINLHEDVSKLNKNSINVKNNLKYVEKFSVLSSWDDISKSDYIELMEHIVPIFELPYFDDVGARLFDLLSYKFSSTKLNQEDNFLTVSKTIYILGDFLLKNKMHIDAVSKCIKTLTYINNNDFLHDTTVSKMEEIRIELRELMRYIEKEITDPIITDFDDSINATIEYDDNISIKEDTKTIDISNFKSLKEKIIDYIKSNSNDRLIYSISHLIKPDNDMVEGFKETILNTTKSNEHWEDLFSTQEEVIIFVRQNSTINEKSLNNFIEKQKAKKFNNEQIEYIKELFVFIFKNGQFSRSDLLEDGLDYFRDIFDSIEINSLLEDIEEII